MKTLCRIVCASAGLLLAPLGVGAEELQTVVRVAARIKLTSPAFAPGKPIPAKYTCDGADVSPPLAWDRVPYGTKSIALVLDDPDAAAGDWVHWVLFDIPPQTKQLAEGGPAGAGLPDGARHGTNDFGKPAYGGPCPPPGKPHRYVFRVYMLDTELGLAATTTKAVLLQALDPHVLGEGELKGSYQRK